MSKRGLAAIALAVAMVWATVAPAMGQAVNPFRDVPVDHWAYDGVERLRRANLVEGYPDGTFRGERTFTRYEMAMVFARTLARMEALIDERIAGHLDDLYALRAQDLQDTQAAIDQARRELAERIGLLEEDVERLWGAIDRGGATVSVDGSGVLTPAAEAAVERVVHERIREVMSDLPDEVVERIVTRVQMEALDDEQLRRLIDEALSEHLERVAGIEGDVDALWSVVASETERLTRIVRDLADEFSAELEALGVRVAELERLFGDLSRRVAAVEKAVETATRRAEAAEAAAQRALAAVGEDAELERTLADLRQSVDEAERRAEAAREAAESGRADEALAQAQAAEEAAREADSRALDALMAAQRAQEDVDRLRGEFNEFRDRRRTIFTGSVGVDVEMRGFSGEPSGDKYGVDYYLLNPRDDADDDDSPRMYDRNRVSQRFDLRTETEVGPGTDLRGELSLLNHSIFRVRDIHDPDPEEFLDGFALGRLDIRIDNEDGRGGVFYGLIDEDRLGGGFNRYVLDPERFIAEDPVREDHRGLVVDGSYRGIGATFVSLDRWNMRDWDEVETLGPPPRLEDRIEEFPTDKGVRQAASGSAALGENWTATVNAVRHLADAADGGGSDVLASAGLRGQISALDVGLIGARDMQTEAAAIDATVATRLGTVDLALNYASIDANYGRRADRPNLHRRTFLGSGLLFQDGQAFTVDASTRLGLIDLRARHYAGDYYSSPGKKPGRNKLDWGDRRGASVTRLDAATELQFGVPIKLEAALASGSDDGLDSRSHSHIKASWKDIALGEVLSWDFSYELFGNFELDEDEEDWNRPNDWEDRNKATLDTRVTWRPMSRLGIYVGYENERVDELDVDAPPARLDENKSAVALGFNYGIDLRNGLLTLGYELQQATIDRDGAGVNPSNRNTIMAAYQKTVGEGRLRLSAKRIQGAGIDNTRENHRNNAVDHIAGLDFSYPLGERFRLDIGGRYIDSRDNEKPNEQDYTATEVVAGLNFDF